MNRLVPFLLLFTLPTLSQTTIQYDSGIVGNQIAYDVQGLSGNLFTGLGTSRTVTKVTVFVTSLPGGIYSPLLLMGLRDSGSAGVNLGSTLINPAALGFNTVTLATPVNFTGTDVWVQTNDYGAKGIPLDAVSNAGQGFHAWGQVQGNIGPIDTMGVVNGTGNPANMWIRISGPAGLPVELLYFNID